MRYCWDDFVLDLDSFRLERAGHLVPLEPKALNLLALVVQRPGHVFTKQELFDALWPNTAVTDHALTRVVSQIRRGLGDEAREARYLETVPTRGYRWIRPLLPEATVAVAAAPPTPDVLPIASPVLPQSNRWPRPAIAAGLAVVATAAALSGWGLGGPTASSLAGPAAAVDARPEGPWPVQQTTHPGLDMYPALSPQGDALAFASDRTGAFELYVRDLGSPGADLRLTNDGGQNVQPAWSPDGRQIAFHSSRHGGVWTMPARGGPARQLAARGSHPAWSPDGRHVAFQSDEFTDVTPSAFGAQNGSTLWVVNADGTGLRALTSEGQPIGGHGLPAWTRNGRAVAFMVFDGGARNGIWLLDLESGAPRLLEAAKGLYEFTFAPDGSAIYAAGGPAARILRLPFDAARGVTTGPAESILVPGVPGVRGLTIAADGASLAFSGLSLSSQIWTQPIGRSGEGEGPARPLTTDTSRRNSLATISPDGSRIAYMSSRQGAPPSVWVMRSDGSDRVPVTPDESADGEPTWFADGRRLAYWSNRGESDGIWMVDVDTRRDLPWIDFNALVRAGGPAHPRGDLAELRFAPSMTTAAFSLRSAPSGRRVLYVATLDRYAARALTDGSASVGYPAWSPDGRSIAVELKDGSSIHAAVVDVATGQLRQLTRETGQVWVRSWSPDGAKIAAATLRDGAWSLRWIDVASGAQGIITPPAAPSVYLRYPEWSPRGDVVVFERGQLRGNIWTLPLR